MFRIQKKKRHCFGKITWLEGTKSREWNLAGDSVWRSARSKATAPAQKHLKLITRHSELKAPSSRTTEQNSTLRTRAASGSCTHPKTTRSWCDSTASPSSARTSAVSTMQWFILAKWTSWTIESTTTLFIHRAFFVVASKIPRMSVMTTGTTRASWFRRQTLAMTLSTALFSMDNGLIFETTMQETFQKLKSKN